MNDSSRAGRAPLRPHARTKPWTQLRQEWVRSSCQQAVHGPVPELQLPPRFRTLTLPQRRMVSLCQFLT
jgi:hypothetical protein